MHKTHDAHLSCKIIVPDWFIKSHWLSVSVIWWFQIDERISANLIQFGIIVQNQND